MLVVTSGRRNLFGGMTTTIFRISRLHLSSISDGYSSSTADEKGRHSGISVQRKRVVIGASDISAIVGQNAFKTADDVLQTLWQKHNKFSFALNVGQTKKDKEKEAAAKDATSRLAIDKAIEMSKTAVLSSETSKIIIGAKDVVLASPTLTEEDKKLALSHLESSVRTTFGTKNEDVTITDKKSDVVSEEKNELLRIDDYFELKVHETAKYEYMIVGRIDCIEKNSVTGHIKLVEVKNRVNKLFRTLRNYEEVQVQVYLQLLGLKDAKLVEQYNDEVFTIDNIVKWDDDKFQVDIIDKVVVFCSRLDGLLTDEVMAAEYKHSLPTAPAAPAYYSKYRQR